MKTCRMKRPKFALGEVVATAQAMATLTSVDMELALQRHVTGDWGKVGKEDRQANERALLTSDRLLSSYQSSSGVKFWIITEADRSATTVLLSSDY